MQREMNRVERIFVPGLAITLLLGLAIGGGSSRDDVFQVVFGQIAAVALIGVLVIPRHPSNTRSLGLPLAFLLALAGVMMAQLIPLPSEIWRALPGREFYAGAAEAAGAVQPWRPISLSPDRTVDSLLGLLPIFAVTLALWIGPPSLRRSGAIGLLWIAVASTMLASFQLSAGPESELRFYRVTNLDAGVGLLANRNHQAALLAMAIPTAAWWSTLKGRYITRKPLRLVIGAGLVLLCLVGAVLTGSRTGLVLCGVGLLGGAALVWPRDVRRSRLVLSAAGSTVLMGAVVAFLFPAQRIIEVALRADPRSWFWPRTLEMIGTFFPFGAGVGTFERVFPRFERPEDLIPEYVNHAHNDFLEIGAEAGIFAYLLLLTFLVWWIFTSIRVWRAPAHAAHHVPLGRLCTIVIAIGLLASATDYPLRTPLIGTLFAGACVLLCRSVDELRRSAAQVSRA